MRDDDREFCMHAVSAFIDRRVRPAMSEAGIKRSYGPMLMAVARMPGCSQKEIAEEVLVDKAHVTRTCSELLRNGFITDSSEGSRQYSLHITKKGQDALDLVSAAVAEAWSELLRDLTDEERECGRRILRKVVATAEAGLEERP